MKKHAFLKILVVFAYVFVLTEAIAQDSSVPLFADGDRVCFVGNSITQSGGYQHYIYLFQATRFPGERGTFFNCGVGGDVASKILARMDEDVFVNEPDHLVLMVGMNDVNRPLYAEKYAGDPAIEHKKTEALERYKSGTTEIVKRFKDYTSSVILLKPSIYDQTARIPTENLFGANDALHQYGAHLEDLANRYQTKLVDFWSILDRLNKQEQRKDSMFTIVGDDRIHPGVTGHIVMAYQFLKQMNAPAYVAKMVINDNERVSNKESINCEIRNLKYEAERISFTCKEGSLPFPLPSGAAQAFSLVPFNDDLNREVLQVSGLTEGKYDLLIDGSRVGTYSRRDLELGINLAMNENTPQYQQALRVMDQCVKIKQLQGKLRLLKRVEYVEFTKAEMALGIDSVTRILEHRLAHKYLHDRYEFNRKLFENYGMIKPQEDSIKEVIRREEAVLYMLNLTVEHNYEIRKKSIAASDDEVK